jgi:hypothetical protein
METYITVSFWMGVFAIVVNLLRLMGDNLPKVKTETVGQITVTVLISTGFAIWAGFLLFA